MNRHQTRELIIRLLYLLDFNKKTFLEEHELIYAFDPDLLVEDQTLLDQTILDQILTNQFYLSLKQGIIDHLEEIDQMITKSLTNYSIDRLSFVDRAIVRLATYELLFTDTPKQIIINEALELTKQYSNLDDDLAKKFNNKLLETIALGR